MFKGQKIKMLVCDMAGTIIQENNLVYKQLYNTVKQIKRNITLEDIHKFQGYHKREVIDHFVKYENLNPKYTDGLYRIFNQSLIELYTSPNSDIKLVDPKIPDFFKDLQNKNIKITLNTGYNSYIQKCLIDKFNLHDCIDDYISSTDVKLGRPHPFMIYKLMDRNNVRNPKQIIKIGDTPIDIQEGKNAGCFTVGVLSGDHRWNNHLKKGQPDKVIEKITDLCL